MVHLLLKTLLEIWVQPGEMGFQMKQILGHQSVHRGKRKEMKKERKKLQQTSRIKEKYCIFIYYMAHQSMIEIEHSDWILSGPYFAVWTAQMDRSHHTLFCFGLICFKLCYIVPNF